MEMEQVKWINAREQKRKMNRNTKKKLNKENQRTNAMGQVLKILKLDSQFDSLHANGSKNFNIDNVGFPPKMFSIQ